MAERARTREIKDFIVSHVGKHEEDIALVTAKKFGISRQGVNKHLRQLVKDGVLSESGSTRSKKFSLAQKMLLEKDYVINKELFEDKVYSQDVLPLLKSIGTNLEVEQRINYCFTEIFNNAIDHSEGTTINISVAYDLLHIRIIIDDNGIGIFKKIKENFQLSDENEAILELSKGKLTTSPKNHSGEGIFFSSRISDRIIILSHLLSFYYHRSRDIQFQLPEHTEGTDVDMVFERNSDRTTKEVFDKYSSKDEDYGFNVTHVPVKLAIVGEENLVSRSQAKRLLAGLDKFKEVALDFEGVTTIGQAFADEIFRVFTTAHPDIHLFHFSANEEVTQMINRALHAKKQSENQEP
jgi:anti-sigma regulatory factor (Ser/Thr protein kinase)/biotin operon repressor